MKSRFNALSASLIAVAVLAACGGGGSSQSTSAAAPLSTSLAGKVIDGYIEGATVCLDLNADQACGAGEPSAITKADGSYSLDTTGLTTAQIQAAHLLTVVPLTAKDADDAGLTLAQAGKSAFNLMAPASAYAAADGTVALAVISPLTTMVSYEMLSGNQTPLATAEANIRTRLGMAPATDLRKDFVAALDATLTQQSRVLAVTIGEVKKSVLAVAGTTDRDAFTAAMDYLQTNAAALQTATETGPQGSVVNMVKAALLLTALVPDQTALIAKALQYTTTNANDAMSIFADGFYTPMFGAVTGVIAYKKISGTNGQWQTAQYGLATGNLNWFAFSYPSNGFNLTSTGWLATPGQALGGYSDASGTVASDGLGGSIVTSTAGYKFRLTTRALDVSGRPVASIAGLVDYIKFVGTPAAVQSTIFGSGSKVFFSQTTPIDDQYSILTGLGTQVSVQNPVSNVTTMLTSIADLISAYSTNNANTLNQFYSTSDRYFSFDAGGTATGGSITLWGTGAKLCSVGTPCRTATGTTSYEIKTVYGQQVLVVNMPASAGGASNLMFAAKGNQLFEGAYAAAATALATPKALFNKAAFNTLLLADSKQTVVN